MSLCLEIILWATISIFFLLIVRILYVIVHFALSPRLQKMLDSFNVCIGRVRHNRLKGGAMHRLEYPVTFLLIDLERIDDIGWALWPIFSHNLPWLSFCSFDDQDHLKDYKSTPDIQKNHLIGQVRNFCAAKSQGNLDVSTFRVQLLTNPSFWGYCFNPISVYYLSNSNEDGDLKAVIAEVSNTPWIEMHTYLLHEQSAEQVEVKRHAGSNNHEPPVFEASWRKAFHVSPFMEMDYMYNFRFVQPTAQALSVQAQMLKLGTKEVFFTASFHLSRLSFTPGNLLYVMVTFPLYTRLVQLWIHIEAAKLFFKGVPTYNHPQGTDVDFGCGITGKRLGNVLYVLSWPFFAIYDLLLGKAKIA
jgi:DUF1365 family protein